MICSQVKSFLEKYNLSGTILVAFSGGYDSMCLLDVLNKLGKNIIAIHLNHNWRGKESLADEENCRNFTKERNIQFYCETLDDSIPKTETVAREARYQFFKHCAKKFKTNIVFTAHNFDDNAETVLYRIIKGTGTHGLQGILEHRDIFYRPFLNISREEIEKYCAKNNLSPNIDSSNSNTKYNRNFIRHKILPLMKEINPKVTTAINSLSNIAKEDFSLQNNLKYEIRELLCKYNLEYDKNKIDKICKFINENKNSKSGKKLSLTNGLWLFVSREKQEIIEKKEKFLEEIRICNIGEYKFGNYLFSILPYTKEITEFPSDNEYMAYINIDKIDFTLRHRKNGDRITPLGMKGSQKLKKYLNEKKIPTHEKDEIVLLCKGQEILWAAGVGLNEHVKVEKNPTHVIKLGGYDGCK